MSSYEKNIDGTGLIIYWSRSENPTSYLFSMSYLKDFFVKNEKLEVSNPKFPISYIVDTPPETKFNGQLYMSLTDYSLNVELSLPVIIKEKLFPSISPTPPIDPATKKLDYNLNLENLNYKNLFPYIYIQPWPNASKSDLKNNFAQCLEEAPGSAVDFYNILVKLKSDGNRNQMEIESVNFINGYDKDLKPVYADEYQQGLSSIGVFYRQIYNLGVELRSKKIITFNDLTVLINKYFGSWEDLYKDLSEQSNKDQYSKIEMSYVALMITFGYNFEWMEKLQLIIITENLLYKGLQYTYSSNSTLPDRLEEEPKPETIHAWCYSTLVLPENIFPLPAINNDNTKTIPVKEWVLPYALGKLRIVRYRLWKYLMGEVSRIESVLKGETKTVHERKLNKSVDESTLSQENNFTWEEAIRETFSGSVNKINKVFQEKVSTTTYNSGTGGAIGGWTVTENPAGGNQKDSNSFARQIINDAVEIINNKIKSSISHSQINEHEENITHQFNNLDGQNDVIGIYRWINKVFKFKTVETGNRVIIEVFCNDPAQYYLLNEAQYKLIEIDHIKSPEAFGVLSYKNISETPIIAEPIKNNSETEPALEGKDTYYLDILEYYEVVIFPQPPEASYYSEKNISGYFQQEISYIIIPKEYNPINASINVTLTDKVSQVTVKVGAQENTLTASGKLDCKLTSADMNGDQLTILISSTLKPVTLANVNNQNTETNSSAEALYTASIKVAATLRENILNEWKYNVYLLVKKGYKEKNKEYYEKAKYRKDTLTSGSTDLAKEIIMQQLRNKSINVLKKHYKKLIKGKQESESETVSTDIDNLKIGEPAYLQFINNSIEWDKLTYYLYPEFENSAVYSEQAVEANFYAFLQSKYARILLPVKNEYHFSFLFFLSSGILWLGKDINTPAIVSDVNYYNQIKNLTQTVEETVTETWKIVVPTSFTMLQNGSELPVFDGGNND